MCLQLAVSAIIMDGSILFSWLKKRVALHLWYATQRKINTAIYRR